MFGLQSIIIFIVNLTHLLTLYFFILLLIGLPTRTYRLSYNTLSVGTVLRQADLGGEVCINIPVSMVTLPDQTVEHQERSDKQVSNP